MVSESFLSSREQQRVGTGRVRWRRRHGSDHGSVATGRRGRRFSETPLAPFSLITDWSNSVLLNFIEALKHFYKISKNL